MGIKNKIVQNYLLLFNYNCTCLLYTSDAADERSSVDLGGRRIIKTKKTHILNYTLPTTTKNNKNNNTTMRAHQ